MADILARLTHSGVRGVCGWVEEPQHSARKRPEYAPGVYLRAGPGV